MSDQPVNKPRNEDLSGAFAPSAKLGRLKPVARRSQQPPATTEQSETSPGSQAAQQPSVPVRRPGRRPGPQVRSADPYAKRGVTLWLSDELREYMRQQVKTREITNGEVVLAAIKTTHRRLPDLVAAENASQVVSGELWDEIVPARKTTTARRQVKIVVTQQQLDVIDALVADLGAQSRSHLISIALENAGGDNS